MHALKQAGSVFVRSAVAATLVLSAIATSSTAAYAGSTQTLSDAERQALCARAVRELEEARKLLADTDARLETARLQLAEEKGKDTLQADEVRRLESEIRTLDEQKANLEKMVVKLEAQVATLTEDNKRVRGERDSARRQRWLFGLGGAAIVALLVVLGGKE